MKVLVAGSTGAVGMPLVDTLIQFGYDVVGLTRSEMRAQLIAAKGARPYVLDVLNQEKVFSLIESVRPDVVIDMLTALPKEYTPEAMAKAAPLQRKVCIEGGGYLLAASLKYGVRRYIAQSSGFLYEPGVGLADESSSFAFDAEKGVSSTAQFYSEIERRLFQADKLEAVALRFGFFYGPRTWYHPDGSVAKQIQKREFPLIGKGEGVWNFIHVKDAAKAAAAAIYSAPGAYNVVNNCPLKMEEWLPAFARYLEAPSPPLLTKEAGVLSKGADFVYYCTKLRGASNRKAKKEFDFEPQNFEWIL